MTSAAAAGEDWCQPANISTLVAPVLHYPVVRAANTSSTSPLSLNHFRHGVAYCSTAALQLCSNIINDEFSSGVLSGTPPTPVSCGLEIGEIKTKMFTLAALFVMSARASQGSCPWSLSLTESGLIWPEWRIWSRDNFILYLMGEVSSD